MESQILSYTLFSTEPNWSFELVWCMGWHLIEISRNIVLKFSLLQIQNFFIFFINGNFGFCSKNCKMASILKLPEPKYEIIIKSIIHILKAHGMPYSKQPKNIKISHICHFGLIEGKSLRLAIVSRGSLRMTSQKM